MTGSDPDVSGRLEEKEEVQRLRAELAAVTAERDVLLAGRERLAAWLAKDRDEAKARVAECEAQIRAALGSEFSRAMCGRKLVASRSVFERRSDDEHELMAIDDAWPTTDRLNPGRADSYA